MIVNCPICGKLTCIHWPEHWVYRRGETYYCSDQCLDVDMVRDMNLIKQVRMERRKRKMARYKKDGTPAKKPGPAKKEKAPGGEIELYSGPDLVAVVPAEEPEEQKEPKITQPVSYDGMVVREVEGLFGRYRRSDIGGKIYIDLENTEGLETMSLTVEQWRSFREEYAKAARILWVEP